MNDFSKILSKAKEIEANMRKNQEKIKKIEADGVSGGDKVKIKINGEEANWNNLRSALKFATLGENIKLDMLVSNNKVITIEI